MFLSRPNLRASLGGMVNQEKAVVWAEEGLGRVSPNMEKISIPQEVSQPLCVDLI